MADRTEVRIGVTWSDTGWCWLDCRFLYTGTQVWVKEVNERGGMFVPEAGKRLPVRLIQYDDRSDPAVSAEAVRKLCEVDHIDVFCTSGSSECEADALPITEEHGILSLNVGSPDDKLFEQSKFHLQCGPSLGAAPRPQPAFWKHHGLTRIAQVSADFWGWDAYAERLRPAVEAEGGLEMVLHEPIRRAERYSTVWGPFPRDFTGWAGVVDRVAAAAPDALCLALPSPAQYRIVRELRKRGLWFRYIEMVYGMQMAKVGLGPEDLLYQFMLAPFGPGVDEATINVGGTAADVAAATRRHLPGADPYPRSYVALAIWEHLVQRAGSMQAAAVMAAAMEESGRIVTQLGTMQWLPNGNTAPAPGAQLGIAQVQRWGFSATLEPVLVWPPSHAQAEPVFTDLPYERRPAPWTGA